MSLAKATIYTLWAILIICLLGISAQAFVAPEMLDKDGKVIENSWVSNATAVEDETPDETSDENKLINDKIRYGDIIIHE